MRNLKRNKGITLVALVITIIVLLILAAVTLNLVMGDSGIFGKARNAKDSTNVAQAEEDVQLRIIEAAAIAEGPVTKASFMQALQKAADEYSVELAPTAAIAPSSIIKNAEEITDDTDINVRNLTRYPDILVKVKSNFTVESTVATASSGSSSSGSGGSSEGGSGNSESGNTETPTSNPGEISFTENGQSVSVMTGITRIEDCYGKRVKYEAGSGQTGISGKTWRLFYVDFNGDFGEPGNIYLKADWGSNNTSLSTTYTPYSKDTTTGLETGTLVRKLNPDWATARGESEDSWGNGEKAAARLCDPSKWTSYASTAYEEGIVKYAIGAPPAEMFMKSYGDKTNQAGYKAKYFANGTSAYGYKYKTATTDNDSDYDNVTAGGTIRSNIANTMYLKLEGRTESGMFCYEWLASPSAHGPDDVCYACALNLDYGPYHGTNGACPLVCLSSNFPIEILGD